MTALSFTYEQRACRFVEANVLVSQSSLIDHLLARNDIPGFTWDAVANLYDDSVDAVDAYLTNVCELGADDLRELPFDERETLAQEQGSEPLEIFEWWWSRPYLARRLSEIRPADAR